MKRVQVLDASNKPLKIILLGDVELLFCVPYALLSSLYYLLSLVVFMVLRAALAPLIRLFSRFNFNFIAAMVYFPCVAAAAGSIIALTRPFSLFDLAAAIVVFFFGATILARIIVEYYQLEDPHDSIPPIIPPSAAEAAAFARMKAEAAALPQECVRHRYDKHVLYVGMLRTMLLIPALVLLLVVPNSWLNCALIAYLALFMYNDFEWIEHIASHTPHGKLLTSRGAPWWASAVEWLRRYVAWPLFGWYPGYYFVTHALHHHTENNGLADWQSTLRYDRASFFGVAKLVTWYGLHFVFPFETVYYLVQKRRFRLLRLLLRGYIVHLCVLAVVGVMEPGLLVILLLGRVSSGVVGYIFIVPWHGFQDARREHDTETSNNHLAHYVHHRKPRIHLWDLESAAPIVQKIPATSAMVLLRPEFSDSPGFWHLQGMLLNKAFEPASHSLIKYRDVRADDKNSPAMLRAGLVGRGVGGASMRELVASALPQPRGAFLQSIDDCLSRAAGKFLLSFVARTTNFRSAAARAD